MTTKIPEVSVSELLDAYEVLLLDAYGALVDGQGAIEGAPALIRHLHDRDYPYFVVTNDASRLPAQSAERFHSLGMPIDASRIITSGTLLAGYFEKNGLRGAPCAVLGPPDSAAYVAQTRGAKSSTGTTRAVSRVEALIIQR